MTREIDPTAPASAPDRRSGGRRERDRRASGRALTVREPAPDAPPAEGGADRPAASAGPAVPGPARADPASAFAAQMLGQSGQRKGLKGGPPVLGAARSTYLGTEYSGSGERRPPAGKTRRTDV